MASKTDIANLALTAVECQVVENIETDESEPAIALRAVWNSARDEALVAREWNFNDRRWRNVAKVAASRHPAPDEFANAYAVPNDCIAVRDVRDASGRVKFRVIKGYVCTEAGPTITIRGAERIAACGQYPVWFVNYFALELAFRIAKGESGSETVRDVVAKLRETALRRAGSMDSREGTTQQPGSRFLAARLTDQPPDTGLLED